MTSYLAIMRLASFVIVFGSAMYVAWTMAQMKGARGPRNRRRLSVWIARGAVGATVALCCMTMVSVCWHYILAGSLDPALAEVLIITSLVIRPVLAAHVAIMMHGVLRALGPRRNHRRGVAAAAVILVVALVATPADAAPATAPTPQPLAPAASAAPVVDVAPADVWWRRGCITRVVDGDTFEAFISHAWGGRLAFEVGVRVRLARADAPETRGAERADGIVVAEAVGALVARRCACEGNDHAPSAYVRSSAVDSFGRPLAVVVCGGIDLDAWLLDQGLARPYGEPWRGLPAGWRR